MTKEKMLKEEREWDKYWTKKKQDLRLFIGLLPLFIEI